MAVLWLKGAQLAYIEEKAKIRPLLLLDDILSELDEKHGQLVVQLAEGQQTILTTTDEKTIDLFSKRGMVIKL